MTYANNVLSDYFKKFLPVNLDPNSNVVVAMSGGVDSSVSAYLLAKAGVKCIGISMQVWDYRNNGGSKSKVTCCAPDDFTDARIVAAKSGIPYYVYDFEKTFRKEVIDHFIDSYNQGETPNPCVECNRKVKFLELRKRASHLGCNYVATGHYAQIEWIKNKPVLNRGAYREKDQSYFLSSLKENELNATIFPVGSMTKDEVRQIALEAGLQIADKPESQDICFISGKISDFLTNIGKSQKKPVIVEDSSGNIVATKSDINHFTIGQRKGLGLSGGTSAPLYIVDIKPELNRITVGSKDELKRDTFTVNNVNWFNHAKNIFTSNQDTFEGIVQVRSRHLGTKVTIKQIEGNSVKVNFNKDWCHVAPGQAAVFYDLTNTTVIGGGTIARNSITQYPISETE
jgi:tRNA-uridine 2-sulfurtransferase